MARRRIVGVCAAVACMELSIRGGSLRAEQYTLRSVAVAQGGNITLAGSPPATVQ